MLVGVTLLQVLTVQTLQCIPSSPTGQRRKAELFR